jgi:GxxExxY protein
MDRWTKKAINDLSYQIIGCAIEVHSDLGPGLLESVYEKCVARELSLRNLYVETQIKVPVNYKGFYLDADLRLDLLVEKSVIVEIKAVEAINPVYEAQVLSYMKLLQKPKGILFNFCSANIFREGQRTFVNDIFASLPEK